MISHKQQCCMTQSHVDAVSGHVAVAAQHAELQQKGKQVFLKALQGESVFDRYICRHSQAAGSLASCPAGQRACIMATNMLAA